VRAQRYCQYPLNLCCHCPPGCIRETPGVRGIVKILGTLNGLGFNGSKPIVSRLRTSQMVVANCLAERP